MHDEGSVQTQKQMDSKRTDAKDVQQDKNSGIEMSRLMKGPACS